jgi:D-inositol-3-phosphate glycosyltransferase
MIYSPLPIQRIAILSVHTSPLAQLGQKKTGGMNVYVRDYTRALAQRRVQVDIYTRATDPDEPYIQYDLGCGCRVINIPAGPLKTIPNDEIASHLDEFAAGVVQFADNYGMHYDLIHSHYWLSGVVAGKLRQAWGPIPIVHMYHTLGHMKNQIARTVSEYAAPVRLLGETHAAQIADTLIAATPAEKAQLVEYYGVDTHKIAVIAPGVDFGRFEPVRQCVAKRRLGIPKTQKTILAVGRIEPLKGLDTLLQAMSLLQQGYGEEIENVRVTIIGGDPNNPDDEMSRLLRLREDLELHSLVDFIGARDQTQLPDYYAAADLVVMPSHYESFGMVALEAMAMGTPVIASRVGGLAYLVQDGVTGYLVPPQNSAAFANRIRRLVTNDKLRGQMSTQAQEYAQTYRWPNVVDRMMELYSILTEPVSVI